MITTSRFLGYDKNEYGDLIVNRKEAEIVSLTFDLYLMNVGSSRIGELLDYLGVKTVTGTTWESGTINGMLCNEKYKGDFHLQKYYTPENKRNHTRKNNGEVQSYYISENHEPIVSPEVWEKVQEVREQRKRDRNIGQHNEVPKPLSLKRNADLPLLRKNTPAQTGLQEENPMALQHLH